MSKGLVDILKALAEAKGVGFLNRPDSWRFVSDYAPQADEADRRKAVMALKSGAFREFFVASDAPDAAARLKMETFWGDDLAWDVVLSFAEAMGMDSSQLQSGASGTLGASQSCSAHSGAVAEALKLLDGSGGARRDCLKAYGMLSSLAASGDPAAMSALGRMFYEGLGVEANGEMAHDWLKKAADKNEPYAMFALGRMLADGECVGRDPAAAAEWFKKAAEAGNVQGMVSYGRLMTEKDDFASRIEACMWFRKAADMGDSDAMLALAEMYVEGKGVAKDETEARRWLEKAAGLGDEEAARKLAGMDAKGKSAAKAEKPAALPDAGMILVKGGSFIMGGYDFNNMPVGVALGDFMIGENEVTQALYEFVMGENPSCFKGPQGPVENVSWYDTVEFCNKLSEVSGLEKCYSGSGNNIKCDFSKNGYRLPTEAEWEYAARGGVKSKDFKYSGSNDIGEVAWYCDNSGHETHPVKSKKPNELGLYNMSGNVWEWCNDWYSSSLYGGNDPKGPASGSYRVARGGSWDHDADYCSVSYRSADNPSYTYDYLGFRLARSAKD